MNKFEACHAPSLLVLDGRSTSRRPLPRSGEVVVGTGSSSDIRLQDPLVADRHLRLTVVDGSTTVEVLSADSITLVNGVAPKRSVVLAANDVIVVGETTLGYQQHGSAKAAPRSVVSLGDFRRRLAEETERFMRYQRPFALVLVAFDPPQSPDGVEALRARVTAAVRAVDVMGWDGGAELAAVFPETTDQAMIPARRILAAIGASCPNARAALLRCPDDGVDACALLAGARMLARESTPGKIAEIASIAPLHANDLSLVAADPLIRKLFELVRRVAASEIPVLVTGETGTGKEIVAQAVHAWSRRAQARMVSINCAAVPESLLESELFGHERGAFSGAVTAKAGLFEVASGGTVFLDEIGDCSARTQADLLRVLETKKFCRVGSLHERETNVRIVAATNRSLENDIAAGRFRQDLYFRLNAATIVVPPLRDRALDLPILARKFLREACARDGRESIEISRQAMQMLAIHDWPGNIRELRNLMEYAAATVLEPVLEASHLPAQVGAKAAPWMVHRSSRSELQAPTRPEVDSKAPPTFRNIYDEIRDLERKRIVQALEASGGARNRAAELIGMPLRTLVTKIKVYELASTPQARGARS
ncbi:MAG: sigma 54-interacting transcriptional regulator [Polyangiaceae bacterium]|jgi:DNA-binding NtrC family response regulator|nr:sigma 54-interacting transcriptional regulator [Polyangiaceae bacterium]